MSSKTEPIASARALVSQYARQTAQKIISTPESPLARDPAYSRWLGLVQELARQPSAGGLTASILQDVAVISYAWARDDKDPNIVFSVQKTLDVAFRNSSTLQKECATEVPQAFVVAFSLGLLGGVDSSKIQLLQRSAYCLLALLSVLPPSLLLSFSHASLLVTLAKTYDVLSDAPTSLASANTLLRLKVMLLDSVHIIFEYTRASSPSQLLDLIYPLLDLPSSTPSSSTSSPFTTRGLLGDYDATFALSAQLSAPGLSNNDPRFAFVQGQLKALAGRATFTDSAQALSPLLPLHHPNPVIRAPEALPAIPDPKGKGKAVALNTPLLPKEDYSAAVSQILDILPDESPAFLEAALAHPAYSGNAESLLGALLEGSSLPGNLDTVRNGEVVHAEEVVEIQVPVPMPEKVDLVASRRNAFEDDPLDFSKLRIGKNRYEPCI